MRRAGRAGERAARGQPARGDPAAAGRRLVRLRGQVPRRLRRLRRPGRPDARADRGGAGGRPPRLPGAGLPRPGPGRLLPRHGARRQRPPGDQRGEHDARLHADLDVPADVGGQRRELPRAGRPAGRRPRWTAARGPLGDPRAVVRVVRAAVLLAVLAVPAGDGRLHPRGRRRRRRAAPATATPGRPPTELGALVVTEVPSGLPRLPDDELDPPAGAKRVDDVADYSDDPARERGRARGLRLPVRLGAVLGHRVRADDRGLRRPVRARGPAPAPTPRTSPATTPSTTTASCTRTRRACRAAAGC